jgi:hypothetical protein
MAATLILSGVILNNAPVPFAWIGLLGCALCVTLMFVGPRRRVVWFNVGFVCVALTATEFLLSRQDTNPTHGEWSCSEPGSFFQDHEVLGYAPRANVSCTVTGYAGGELVYEAAYTINEHSLRATPEPSETSHGSILFFGGSFTFGEGVNDPETLPYSTATRVGQTYSAHNFGFHGYGPHQMLAALELGVVDDVVEEEPRYVIYQGIPEHPRRVAGFTSWDLNGPKYVLSDDGEVIRVGPFHEGWRLKVLLKLRKSHLFSFLEQGLLWRVRQPQIDLYLGIIERSRQIADRRYDGAEFHVVFWDHEENPWTDAIVEGLSERGIPVHRISGILPGIGPDDLSYVLHDKNRHPNPRAYERIAEYIARKIVDADGPVERRHDADVPADR